MKKIILSALAICAFAFTTNAQDVTFGAKAGLNMANLAGDIEDNDMLIGAHIGGMAEIMLGDEFGIQPELLFSMQGTKNEDASFNLTYLNLPILAKYFVTDEVSLVAGPQVGFLMSAQFDGDDAKDGVSGIDFGLGLGAEYKMDSGLNLGLRYNLGLSNINDYDVPDDVDLPKTTNSVIQVSVGYFFN